MQCNNRDFQLYDLMPLFDLKGPDRVLLPVSQELQISGIST